MKIIKYARQVALLSTTAVLLVACDKVDQPEPLGDNGKTIIKVAEGGTFDEPGTSLIGVDFVATPQTTLLLDVRRDVPSTAEMNKSQTVTIKVDTAMLRVYNEAVVANGGNPYLPMPSSWYTTNPAITWGGTFDLTFAPGELGKQLSVTIPDASLFDPSSTYAFPFTIVSASPDNQIGTNKSYIKFIGAKNNYDGVYELTWTNYHPTSNSGYTGDVTTVHMITTGGDKCKLFWPLAGTFCAPAVLGGGLSYFGAQEPEYTFDATTHKVTVQNAYSGATTFYSMNPGFDSHYDPSTKAIYAKWGYNYVGGNFNAATSREWTQSFSYVGPR